MKLKRILCMLVAIFLLSTTAVYTAFAEEDKADINKEVASVTECIAPKDAYAALDLENPCEVDENGNIALEGDAPIDLILPKKLGGQELTSISAESFAGCPYIRSVVIPETILEIGKNAFTNCEFLETIYVIGHSEDDLTLGANWNGDAEVVYVVNETEEKEIPAAEDANKAEEKTPEDVNKEETPAEEQPSDKADVKDPSSSDSADAIKENAGTEEKTPKEENGSDEEKQPASEQPDNSGESSTPSDDAGTADSQGNESVSNEGNTDANSSAEGSEGAEN